MVDNIYIYPAAVDLGCLGDCVAGCLSCTVGPGGDGSSCMNLTGVPRIPPTKYETEESSSV